LLQTPAVVFCGVDTLIPLRGRIEPGFDEFTAALEHVGIPVVWVTRRTRLQLDDPRRRIGHNHPFIAEDGCGVYLPEGYFNLRHPKAFRLGRFTCIPVAQPQPAASEALDALSSDTRVPVVSLRSLSPRELSQNTGLPAPQSELARQRDFDELFFFAGASEGDVDRFLEESRSRGLQLRQDGALWSLAVGANLKECVGELSKLYNRVLRSHPAILGIATPHESEQLFRACNRNLLLTDRGEVHPANQSKLKYREIALTAPDAWDRVVESITSRN
jgi:mannosyl-3-phosphoglycerate phosphatase